MQEDSVSEILTLITLRTYFFIQLVKFSRNAKNIIKRLLVIVYGISIVFFILVAKVKTL